MQRRVHHAGRDGVHADAGVRVLHRQMLGDRFEPAFGEHGHRRRDTPDRVAGQGRRDGNDTPPGLLRDHVLDGELGDVQEALEVRRDERPEVLGRVVRERLGEEDAGVIDQGVNRREPREGVSTIVAAAARSPMWPATNATWSDAVTAVDWVTVRDVATTLKPRSINPCTMPAPIPCDAPVTMAVFRWLLMVGSLAMVW